MIDEIMFKISRNPLKFGGVSLITGIFVGFAFNPVYGILKGANLSSNDILVIVTTFYAILTGGLVWETREGRRQEIDPVINLELDPYGMYVRAAKIENIGNGPAKDTTATIKLAPNGPKSEIRSKNIATGGFTGSREPKITKDEINEYDRVVVDGEYTNVWGERRPFTDTFEMSLLEENDGIDSIMDRDETHRQVRKIEGHLKDISDAVEMNGFETYLKLENREKILGTIIEHDGLTLREICAKTGLEVLEAAEIVEWLYEAGAVDYPGKRADIFDDSDLQVSPTEESISNFDSDSPASTESE